MKDFLLNDNLHVLFISIAMEDYQRQKCAHPEELPKLFFNLFTTQLPSLSHLRIIWSLSTASIG